MVSLIDGRNIGKVYQRKNESFRAGHDDSYFMSKANPQLYQNSAVLKIKDGMTAGIISSCGGFFSSAFCVCGLLSCVFFFFYRKA